MPERLLARVRERLGAEVVVSDRAALAVLATDLAEGKPAILEGAVRPASAEAVAEIVKIAAELRVPLIPRVAGTSVAGLAAPEPGAVVLDLGGLDRILSIDPVDAIAVLEPGVTFGAIEKAIREQAPHLTVSYPLSPPEASVVANALLDGLGNLSLRHGTLAEAIAGLEIVRGDGTLLRTGSWALAGAPPFARAPLPDLTGLFVSAQGTTGIVTKLALELHREPRFRQRSFIPAGDRRTAVALLSELPALEILSDLGAVSWPLCRMALGGDPEPDRDAAEPEFLVHADLGAMDEEILKASAQVLDRTLAGLRRRGLSVGEPIPVQSFAKLLPSLARLASFPTRIDFLLDHAGGGLSWVGTYGPGRRLGAALEKGHAVMAEAGAVPAVVMRPMKGGRFAVLRYVHRFDRGSDTDRRRVRGINEALADVLLAEGFVMYKSPDWAVRRFRDRFDPGFRRLVLETREVLDPLRILNPSRWPLA